MSGSTESTGRFRVEEINGAWSEDEYFQDRMPFTPLLAFSRLAPEIPDSSGDGENNNYGVVNIDDEVYAELTDAMHAMHNAVRVREGL